MRAWETTRGTEVAGGGPAQARQGEPGAGPLGQRRRPSGALLPLGVVGAVLLGLAGGPLRAWAQDELFVANSSANSITVYTRTASGDTAPTRTLQGAATGLSFPTGIVVDTVHDELVVANANNNSIRVYPRTASGNTAPLRTLQGVATGLSNPFGVVVDTANNELVVTNFFNGSITVYPRTASGNTAPLRTLQGVATGLGFPSGVVVDTMHDELVVGNFVNNSIRAYPRTASGNTAPLRTLIGGATGLNGPRGVVVDTVHDELLVGDFNNSIRVYPRTASGNTAPLRTLIGGATGLSNPFGVVVDMVNNELVVTNAAFPTARITVYSRTASGNTAPTRTLSGGLTGLDAPFFLAVTTTAAVEARLTNISTRGRVETGDNVMIAGFIIGGDTPKTVLVRAIGPSLAAFGVPGVLADPTLQLFLGQTAIAENNDWQVALPLCQASGHTCGTPADITATGLAPSAPQEAAVLITLNPGPYTAIVSGVGGTTGVGLVEVFGDPQASGLINLSTRALVQTGDNVMIGGFIIGGTTPKTIVVRAIGPSLASFGVPGALANPVLQLFSGQTAIAENDDWQVSLPLCQQSGHTCGTPADIASTGLAPTQPLEAVVLIQLPPGPYTAIVRGVGGATGVGLVEVFDVNDNN